MRAIYDVSLDQSLPPKRVSLWFATKCVIFKTSVVKDFGTSELQKVIFSVGIYYKIWDCFIRRKGAEELIKMWTYFLIYAFDKYLSSTYMPVTMTGDTWWAEHKCGPILEQCFVTQLSSSPMKSEKETNIFNS